MCFARTGRSIELIDSDYAFLNERLAKHYGVPGVEGDEIRKVQLPPDSPLGWRVDPRHVSVGHVQSDSDVAGQTRALHSGQYSWARLLRPAPPMVPELEESADQSEIENPTVRQLLEIHRSEALCRSCHARFDPLGLAFENFTAIGTWRDEENGQPIEPGGRLISGESFDNVTELKKVLAGPRRAGFLSLSVRTDVIVCDWTKSRFRRRSRVGTNLT